MTTSLSSFCWDKLPSHYKVIMCDLWGVVHNGVRLNPGAAQRLEQWRSDGRIVLLITNAPRTAGAVERQLERLSLPRRCWNALVTGGEAGINALTDLRQPVGFLGTPEDRSTLEIKNIRISDAENVLHVACAGLELERPRLEQYLPQLERWVASGVRLHCLNADRLVMRGGVAELCAGALADLYGELGGPVSWYGKPHRSIYDHALRLAGHPRTEDVLAIGDSLPTDMLGAARMGFDAVFVRGGIHAHEPFPTDFGTKNGVGTWRPIATVDGLN